MSPRSKCGSTFNPRTWKAGAPRARALGQPHLHSECQASQRYTLRLWREGGRKGGSEGRREVNTISRVQRSGNKRHAEATTKDRTHFQGELTALSSLVNLAAAQNRKSVSCEIIL